jgi:hypothetical protein
MGQAWLNENRATRGRTRFFRAKLKINKFKTIETGEI